jgi:hypothetical protein
MRRTVEARRGDVMHYTGCVCKGGDAGFKGLRPAPSFTTALRPHPLHHTLSARFESIEAGAGERNRTVVISLEGCCSTIELHPRTRNLAQHSCRKRVLKAAPYLRPATYDCIIFTPPNSLVTGKITGNFRKGPGWEPFRFCQPRLPTNPCLDLRERCVWHLRPAAGDKAGCFGVLRLKPAEDPV